MSAAALCFVLALLVGSLVGFIGMPIIRSLQVGQTVRADGPKTHFKKSGTPTFGGVFFIVAILAALGFTVWHSQEYGPVLAVVVFMLCFAGVGFVDDYIKVRVDRAGLSVKHKTIALGLFSLAFALYYLYGTARPAFLILPFTAELVTLSGLGKVIYLVVIVPFIFYVANSVNLADGLDGLCTSLSIVNFLFLGTAIALLSKRLPQLAPLQMLAWGVAGACFSFLLFNWKPARIMMGDTGSMALGSVLVGLAILSGLPWLLLVQALVFMLEGLSTILQVTWFKLSGGKRLFRMAPLHHHFELGGWSELKVVYVFVAVALGAGLLSLLLL